ncbi:hypothetical protein [Streptomyces sp. NPDC091371]|uniref:hypothetical protein n=1 Tax=Streptomyces sp. NPDC091371 TaxID=3155303 RepID=UPI0034240FF8
MPNGRAISAAPETVVAGGGTTARFDGARLRIVRGRTAWTLPVRAIGSAALTASGAVRIEISGVPGSARHGLGSALELQTPNAHAAKAFLGQLTAVLAAIEPAADGHALVQVEMETRQSSQLGARGRQAVAIALLLVLYAVPLVALGQLSPRKGGTAAFSLGVGGVLGLVGGFMLWRMGRRVRSLWLLRKRGIGVVGTVTGGVQHLDKGGPLWIISKLAFTTVDGQKMRDVQSVVSIWFFSCQAVGSQVELSYDPERPERASRPLTVGFAFRTLLVAAVALIPVAACALCILVNVPV